MLLDKMVSRGNGLLNSEILSIWLRFPNCDAPFLEIHEHKNLYDREQPRVNEPGFGHLSFQVENISSTLSSICQAGGSQVGEVVNFGSADKPFLIVCARDPEGNIVELEQPSS